MPCEATIAAGTSSASRGASGAKTWIKRTLPSPTRPITSRNKTPAARKSAPVTTVAVVSRGLQPGG